MTDNRASNGAALLARYERGWFRPDVVAGITVTAYLVPQVMAYAQLAGLDPVVGLWSAIVPTLRPAAGGFLHPLDRERACRRAVAGVYEHHEARAADVEGELRRQLMTPDDRHPIQRGSSARRSAACQPSPSSVRSALP